MEENSYASPHGFGTPVGFRHRLEALEAYATLERETITDAVIWQPHELPPTGFDHGREWHAVESVVPQCISVVDLDQKRLTRSRNPAC